MDDNAKHASSYQLDQEILDARGIDMTVEEVAGLPTCKYSDRVHSLKLNEGDLAFLKGLRRRIKNRLASQNSRRRSVEHLRRLTRELRAVRACRRDALAERRALAACRRRVRDHCAALRRYLLQILQERSDNTQPPSIEINLNESLETNKQTAKPKEITVKTDPVEPSALLSDCFKDRDENIFECRIEKLVQQSVNHIFKTDNDDKKKVFAKTIFISNEKLTSDVKSIVMEQEGELMCLQDGEVLNLSVKEGKRRGHGRKQSAPRRIVYAFDDKDDGVLDLKIKKENQ